MPGALSALLRLAAASGARLAWIPRRAGERGAIEAGALPNLLPVGRPVADETARAEVARAWDVASLPEAAGRDTAAMLAAALDGELDALVIAGVDPYDLPTPQAALLALENTPFIVSLEQRASAVTDRADVVLPVAAVAEKSGTFVDWEGRGRTFEEALPVPGVMRDLRVIAAIADEHGRAPRPARPRRRPPRARLARRVARPGPRPPGSSGRAAAGRRPGRPSWPPGTSCSTTAACRTASRTWRAPPARPWRWCPRPPRPSRASPTATRSPSPPSRAR